MTIALTYNVKHTRSSTSLTAQNEAEFDSPETVEALKKALESENHKVIKIEADDSAYSRFQTLKNEIDIVFNVSEGLRGQARESQIPAILEMLNIPYTHSGVLAQAVTLDKALTKKILTFHGISTPKFLLIRQIRQISPILTQVSRELSYPLIVKPNSEGSSKGIFNKNLVFDEKKLSERIAWLLKTFKQPVLIEEFLSGREFTVSILGNSPPKVLPIVEQNFEVFPENMPHFASYEAKWLFEDELPNPHDAYFCPAPIDKNLKIKIDNICLAAWDALELKDVARIDLRLDHDGNPSILEVNTLPGLISDPNIVTYLPIAARKAGYTYETLVNTILNEALKRYGLLKSSKSHIHIAPKPLILTEEK